MLGINIWVNVLLNLILYLNDIPQLATTDIIIFILVYLGESSMLVHSIIQRVIHVKMFSG